MISNLPLLFVKGEPTSLSKMSAYELECFITFLVHCSLGHDTVKNIERPSWWPSNVPFSDPFVRPTEVPKDWASKLRDLVRVCYKHHCSEFLLTFCEDLSKNPPGSLQYVNHCDSTISVYMKSSRKLLFTFRNENLSYDKPDRKKLTPRKCLLPHRQKPAQPVVESGINIILCDTCDRMFDNLKEVQEHEKICSQRETANSSPLPLDLPSASEPEAVIENDQGSFLKMLGLHNSSEGFNPSPVRSEVKFDVRRNEGREKKTLMLTSLTQFPFSSPCGLRINSRNRKQAVDLNVKREHLDRYCTSDNMKLFSKHSNRHYPVRYKKPDDYWTRYHIFPYQRNKHILDLKSQLLYLQCKSVSVVLKCLTVDEIKSHTDRVDYQNYSNTNDLNINSSDNESKLYSNDIEFVSHVEISDDSTEPSENNIYDDAQNSVNRTSDVASENQLPLDIIDLCSDDEDRHDCTHLTPVICQTDRNTIPDGFVLAAVPELLQPLNPNVELESAQCRVSPQPDDIVKSGSEDIQKNDLDTDPLDINVNNCCSNNVISLD